MDDEEALSDYWDGLEREELECEECGEREEGCECGGEGEGGE